MSNSRFSIVVPGREIPEWFMCQNNGSSITHGWPSYKYKKNKVVEYCICCVFRVHNHLPPARGRIHLNAYQLKFRMKDGGYFIDFGKKFGQCGSDHLWLLYFSIQYCNDQNWHLESDLVELSFWPDTGPRLEVIRCGFHPVYMHPVKEYNRTTYQWNRVTAYNLNGCHQNFDGSKPSLIEYVGSEARGSDCCDDEEQQQRPKELENSNKRWSLRIILWICQPVCIWTQFQFMNFVKSWILRFLISWKVMKEGKKKLTRLKWILCFFDFL